MVAYTTVPLHMSKFSWAIGNEGKISCLYIYHKMSHVLNVFHIIHSFHGIYSLTNVKISPCARWPPRISTTHFIIVGVSLNSILVVFKPCKILHHICNKWNNWSVLLMMFQIALPILHLQLTLVLLPALHSCQWAAPLNTVSKAK